MKLEKLMIYGFGKHEDVEIDFSSEINVLYGLNEAGKTTIQQFILHILFGFPQRNSSYLRYEPKSGGKYGGQVQIIDDNYGRCTIERIRGKSAGEVTVFFDDGTSGGEDELKNLIRQYDRGSFESIFSFSLLQLQGFEKMNEDELSRTLLASGTTGVDSLLELEKRMEKNMGDLFKRAGRNPEMNVKIAELQELEGKLKEEQAKLEEYTPAITRLAEIDEQIHQLRNENQTTRDKLQQFTLIRQYLPIHLKKQVLLQRKDQSGEVHFPADGIRRYESLASQIKESEASKARMTAELEALSSRNYKKPNAEVVQNCKSLLDKETEWVTWRSAKVSLQNEVKRLSELIRRLFEQLDIGEGSRHLTLESNISIHKKEELHELLTQIRQSEERAQFLADSLKGIQREIAENEEKQHTANLKDFTQDEAQQVKEWPDLKQKLAEAKAFVSFQKHQPKHNNQMVESVLFGIALAFILVGVLLQQWLIAGVGVIAGAVGAILYFNKGKNPHQNSDLKASQELIAKYAGKEKEMETLVHRFESHKLEKERLIELSQELQKMYGKLSTDLEEAQGQASQLRAELSRFMKSYGFDNLPSLTVLPDVFRMISELQEANRDLEENKKQLSIIEENLSNRQTEIEGLLQEKMSVESLYDTLRKKYIQMNEQIELATSTESKLEDLTKVHEDSTSVLDSLTTDLQALLQEAGAETEEGYYAAYDQQQEARKLEEQLESLNLQLPSQELLLSFENVTENELEEQIVVLEKLQETNNLALDDLIEEKAALTNKTEQLLTDETVAELRQLFEMKKSELAELARSWSVSKAVFEAIQQTMTELKESKLPKVLQHAEVIFSELTDFRYTSFGMNEDNYFEAVGSNGMRYPIIELSQATKEQAYIALRFALASSLNETAPFPIIMDDPFVHFDKERLSRMVKYIERLKQHHQFIYFTCHEEMKDKWAEATIIDVSKIGSGKGAVSL